MVSLQEVEKMIKAKLPDAQVIVRDLTGGGDHLEAVVVSSEFEGKSKVVQHQMVYGAVASAMADESIHALALNTYTPEAWQKAAQSA